MLRCDAVQIGRPIVGDGHGEWDKRQLVRPAIAFGLRGEVLGDLVGRVQPEQQASGRCRGTVLRIPVDQRVRDRGARVDGEAALDAGLAQDDGEIAAGGVRGLDVEGERFGVGPPVPGFGPTVSARLRVQVAPVRAGRRVTRLAAAGQVAEQRIEDILGLAQRPGDADPVGGAPRRASASTSATTAVSSSWCTILAGGSGAADPRAGSGPHRRPRRRLGRSWVPWTPPGPDQCRRRRSRSPSRAADLRSGRSSTHHGSSAAKWARNHSRPQSDTRPGGSWPGAGRS